MTTKKNNQAPEAGPGPIPRTALSMGEFAVSFGVSRSMAYHMLNEGLYKTFLIGRRRFVAVEEAKKLAARLTSEAG